MMHRLPCHSLPDQLPQKNLIGPFVRIAAAVALALILFLAVTPSVSAQDAAAPEQLYAKKAAWPETLAATRAAMAAACASDPALALKVWLLIEKDFPIPCDWMRQDAGADCGRWLAAPEDTDTLTRMLAKVFAELGSGSNSISDSSPSTLRSQYDALLQSSSSQPDPQQLLALYVKACEARRALRLRPLLQKAPQTTPRIVFTKHYNMGGSHYAYTEGQSDAQAERHFIPGAALCLLTMNGLYGTVETLLEDPHGVIRDPDVSYDGRRILFAWKKSNLLDDYHLYAMDAATHETRQLTFGRGVADYEGAYLPSGDILFNSTRCVQSVDCFWTEVSNLYTCAGDGRFLRRLTFDQVHDNYPTVTGDGRILYTRWEYNDRGQIFPQPLYQMNPDGTAQTEFYGNNSYFPTSILHARAIPGGSQVLAVASGHHTRQTGKLILIDPAKGRQESEGVRLAAPLRATPDVQIDAFGQEGELFQYPYPLGENECLVTYHPTGWAEADSDDEAAKRRGLSDSMTPRFGIYFMTLDGRRELLAADPERPCNQPVPLAPRPAPRPRPSMVDYHKADGTFYVQDVYAGPGLAGVERGTVKALRVVKLDFRAAALGSNNNDHALISTPVAIGNGAWDPKTILGDAKVYEDGSVFFTAPARTPLYFQLLDEKGRMVQSMRSWSTLQPGENASCVGCHEHKNSTPLDKAKPTQALKAGAQALAPFYGPARGFSFAKEVQPILDRHCVRCHNGEAQHPFSLLGRAVPETETSKRIWSESYVKLTGATGKERNGRPRPLTSTAREPLVNWISAQSMPPLLPPYSAGSARSGLIAKLDKGHNGVKLTREEMDKLAAWIDLAVPFCGDYLEANAWSEEERGLYSVFEQKRARLAAEERQNVAVWLAEKDGNREAAPARAGERSAKVALELLDAAGTVQSRAESPTNGTSATLIMDREYRPGERFRISGAEYLVVRLGAGLPESLVYAPGGKLDWPIPAGPQRRAYPPAAFAGAAHQVSARAATRAELDAYRNLALNPWDVRGDSVSAGAPAPGAFFPHASSNNECRNDPVFFARCAIDGNLLNRRHGAWPYESWGPDRGTGIWWRLDFGRPVQIDRLVIAARADFPHDSVWPRLRVEYSDGGRDTLNLKTTDQLQLFPIRPRTVSWLRFANLDAPPAPNNQGWRALTEVQVWGREAAPGEDLAGNHVRYRIK